jgi:hypothetical protein
MTKKCARCHEDKDTGTFYKNKSNKSGFDEYCKSCRKLIHRAYRDTDKGRATFNRCSREYYRRHKRQVLRKCKKQYAKEGRQKWYQLKRQFGIDQEDYMWLLSQQNGVCAVCEKPPGSRHLAVDHDHKTNKIRGLLCSNCNAGIGMLRDDPKILLAAVSYLQSK